MDKQILDELRELFEELKEILGEVNEEVEKEKAPKPLQKGDERLSKHFTLKEFTKSDTASRKGISNNPTKQHKQNLVKLCEEVLEPIREHFGRPIKISSGYRSKTLNRAIGGSKTSDHSLGRAADFEIDGLSNYQVAKWIEKNLNYRQLILEFYTPGQPNSGWIHVSYAGAPHKNQELTATRRGGKTVYSNGLVE